MILSVHVFRAALLTMTALFLLPASGQKPVWANEIVTNGEVSPILSAADQNGNSYVYSRIYGTVYMGSGSYKDDSGDFLLQKFDAKGNHLWTIQSDHVNIYDLRADENHVYLCGSFYGFGKIGNTVIESQGNVGYDAFILRLSGAGLSPLLLTGTGWGTEIASSLDVDRYGNMYVTGSHGASSVFGTHTLTSSSGENYYVAKFDINGTVQWITQGKRKFFALSGTRLEVSNDGQSVVTTGVAEKYYFDPTDTATFTGSDQTLRVENYITWLARLDFNGVVRTVKPFLEVSHVVSGIGTDKNHNLYCATRGYGADPQLWKFDNDLNWVWTVSDAKGIYDQYSQASMYKIAVTEKGDIYSCYTAKSASTSLQYTTIPENAAIGSILKHNSNGGLRWRNHVTSRNEAFATSIAANNAGKVFLAGLYRDSCSIGSVTSFTNPSGGYIILYNDKEIDATTAGHPEHSSDFFFPNPVTDHLRINAANTSTVSLYNLDGTLVHQKTFEPGLHLFDFSSVTRGLYFIRTDDGTTTRTGKLLRE